MFDTEVTVGTKEAARVLAVAQCLTRNKGKLLKLPAIESDWQRDQHYLLWSGLITSMTEVASGVRIEYLDGSCYLTSLGVDPLLALMNGE